MRKMVKRPSPLQQERRIAALEKELAETRTALSTARISLASMTDAKMAEARNFTEYAQKLQGEIKALEDNIKALKDDKFSTQHWRDERDTLIRALKMALDQIEVER